MRQARAISERDVEGAALQGDTAHEKRDDRRRRCSSSASSASRPGRSLERGEDERDELLYVVSGPGTLVLDGEPHPLEPDLGAYVRAGERYGVENPGPDELLVVSVAAPRRRGARRPAGHGPFADQPELRADAKRTFRYLVNQDAGCAEVTQFVGVVEPCRAPDHSHSYDEVGLHRRRTRARPLRRRADPARAGLVLPPAAGGGALHREQRAGGDADPRRLPSVRRSGLPLVRRGDSRSNKLTAATSYTRDIALSLENIKEDDE